jgi:hypothetical protein
MDSHLVSGCGDFALTPGTSPRISRAFAGFWQRGTCSTTTRRPRNKRTLDLVAQRNILGDEICTIFENGGNSGEN